jgi:hypothetical protein
MGHKSKKHRHNVLAPSVSVGTIRQSRRTPTAADFDFDEFERKNALREARHEELRYRIAPDCKVHITFRGIATQDAIRKLIDYLEMGIGDFPQNADNSAAQG